MKENKLIAEFMGIKNTNGLVFQDVNTKEFHPIKYHESWDWLMPVVKKCWEIAKELDISFDKMMEKYRFDYIAYGDLDESYESVVEFINEYNKENESND